MKLEMNWMTHLLLSCACALALPACDLEEGDSERAKVVVPENSEDFGGCVEGGCKDDGCGTDGDAQPESDQSSDDAEPVEPKEPGQLEHVGNPEGDACVPASDINAKIDAGCTFDGGMDGEQAKAVLTECLEANNCFNGGFQPAEGMKPEHWDRCFDVLCDCNEDIIDGCGGGHFVGLDCDMTRVPGGGGPGTCGGGAGNIGFFKGANGIHAMEITSMEGPDSDGNYTLEVRDPNNPGSTDPILVDPTGEVLESLSEGVDEGGQLIGCFEFTPIIL